MSDSDDDSEEEEDCYIGRFDTIRTQLGQDEDLEEPGAESESTGFTPLGKYFRLYRALNRAPAARTPRDKIEIRQAVETIPDPCVNALEEPVKMALAERLKLEEFAGGEEIFNYGDPCDKLYLLWSGQVQVEVPRVRSEVDDGTPTELVKGACYKAGQESGELALFSTVKKRKMRLLAHVPTQLLVLREEDYRWCRGFSQESFVHERVNFLRMADRATLGEVPEAELRAMAARLREEHYMGEQVVLKQGAEVDTAIWVKSGFCKVMRHLHPRFHPVFDLYANKTPPPPNPFAPTSNDPDEAIADHPEPGPGAQEFRRLLQRYGADDGRSRTSPSPRRCTGGRRAARSVEVETAGGPGPGAGGSSGSAAPARVRRQATGPQGTPRPPPRPSDGAAGAGACSVIVDVLQEGRSFGVMEMMEGLDYQCSVVADPWVEVYAIKKNDLIRNTSKGILHRLFCDYKARLTDERIINQLKQHHRWNNYKKGLLEDIRNRRTNSGIIDRREPHPRLAGVGNLRQEDFERLGNGEKINDSYSAGARVQLVGLKRRAEMNGLTGTLVEQKEDSKWLVRLDNDQSEKLFKATHLEEIPDEVQYVFDVKCLQDLDGSKKLDVQWECRDASMVELEKRILMAVATANYREKIRRKQHRATGALGHDAAAAAAPAAPGGDAAAAPEAPTLPPLSGRRSPSSGSSSSNSPKGASRVHRRTIFAKAGKTVLQSGATSASAATSAAAPGADAKVNAGAKRRLLTKRSTSISLNSATRMTRSSQTGSERGDTGSGANMVRFVLPPPASARG